MKTLKISSKIQYGIVSVSLSLIMVLTGFLPMTVQAASGSQVIDSLKDIPSVLEDKDTQALGSGKIYYRKANVKVSEGVNTNNYKNALKTQFQDDQYKMNQEGSLVDDWEYVGASILVKHSSASDSWAQIADKYIKNLTTYDKATIPANHDRDTRLFSGVYEGTDNSLKNAQNKAIAQMKDQQGIDGKLGRFCSVNSVAELNDETEGPVYYKTLLVGYMNIMYMYMYRAVTVYFHNFKVSPIYPMNEGSYKQEISDVQEESPIYTSGFRNDSGVELSGTQTLSNSISYSALNSVSGSKAYTYEQSSSVEYKKTLGVFGEITGNIGFSASQAIESGWSKEKSESKETQTSSEASMILPPYTAAYIKQQQKKQTAVTYYKCPVLITYDVMIAGYDSVGTARSFLLGKFTSTARASLKNRAVLHPTDTDKDGINWTKLRSSGTTKKAIYRISRNIAMCTAGGSYTENLTTTESKVDDLIATRPLNKVVSDHSDQKIAVGTEFSLNKIKLEGLNRNNASFYGFQDKNGIWKVTDADGTPIENKDVTLDGAKGTQKVLAKKEGTYYLTYFIDEDQYHTITNMNHYATNATVTRPTIVFIAEDNNIKDNNTSNDQKEKNKDQQMENIKIDTISNKIAAGKKVTLTTNLPKNKVKWKSSNPKLVKVDKNGVVRISKKAAGKKITITAIAMDGSGRKKTFVITVMKGQVKKITIKGRKNVKAGKALKLKAIVKAEKGANKKIRWKSSNPKYATVTSSGKVKSRKAGKKKTVKITAIATDGSGKKTTIKIKIK